MQLKHSDTDKMFEISEKLVLECFELFKYNLTNPTMAEELVDVALQHVKTKFMEFVSRSSRHKRKLDDKFYVEPQEYAIGLKWKQNLDHQSAVVHHSLTQESFIYIPIVKQLDAIFSDSNFYRLYCEYNENVHNDNVYRNFSSGSIY